MVELVILAVFAPLAVAGYFIALAYHTLLFFLNPRHWLFGALLILAAYLIKRSLSR